MERWEKLVWCNCRRSKYFKGKSNIYALTTQTDNFEKLDATKVLGIMSADKVNPKTKLAEIFKIGTNPKYAYEQNKNIVILNILQVQ